MAINKNFVVKNGLEVNSTLLVADSANNKVGIGSTIPAFELDVVGGIGATDIIISGLATVTTELNVGTNGSVLTVLGIGGSVGVGTALPGYLLDVRGPGAGTTSLYVQGDADISERLYAKSIEVTDLTVTGVGTIPTIDVTVATIDNLEGTNLSFSGIATVSEDLYVSRNVNITGITTLQDNLFATNAQLDNVTVSGITTTNSLSIGSTQIVSNERQLQNIASLDATTTATIETAVANAPNTQTDLNVTGITTLGDDTTISGNLSVTGFTTVGGYLDINNSADISGDLSVTGVVTASAFVGDGSQLTGGGIGIQSTGISVGYGITTLNFRGSSVSTVEANEALGITTITLVGGGGGGGASGDDGQIQFATSGSLDSSADLVFDGGTINIKGTDVGIGSTAIYAVNTGAQFFTVDTSDVGIKTASIGIGTTAPLYKLHVVGGGTSLGGDVFINEDTVIGGNTNITGVCTAQDFDSLSDVNYKTNIETVSGALTKVEQMRGVQFDWKDSGQASFGVVAQELEQVLPELVRGSDPRTVNYNGIIGVLIEAIKELSEEVRTLKGEI
tara:strand:+ start:182 stop:1867 length:1686 start_codon:yes stop_codon:yes gene_type:complete